MKKLVAILALLMMAACGASGKMDVLVKPQNKIAFKAADYVEEKSNIGVPSDVQTTFQEYLLNHLVYKGGFSKGRGLLIKYRFTDYLGGNQAARMIAGIFGAGKGWLAVEAKYYDAANPKALLGKITARSEIRGGGMGGSYSGVIDYLAWYVAQFAYKHFR